MLFTSIASVYLLLLCAETVIATHDGVDQLAKDAIDTVLRDNQSTDVDLNSQFMAAINQRCWVATKINISELEPEFGLLKADDSIVWLKVSSSDEEILAAGFQIEKMTTVIIPGYTQHIKTVWVRAMRGLIVHNGHAGDGNYFFMNWPSKGTYTAISARARPMGDRLADFLQRLIDLGADRMKMHLIGHSISAHIASFAGKKVQPPIGRITAVDPAGPCFGKWLNRNDLSDHLAPTDAYQVDVSHYDDKLLGITGSVGQFDIFVNGGSNQPGCPGPLGTALRTVAIMVLGLNKVYSPAHSRSTAVASTQQAESGCQHVAYECASFEAFKNGECGQCDEENNQCFFMGFPFQYKKVPVQPLRQASGRQYHIMVDNNENLCNNHYQVLIEFEPGQALLREAKPKDWYFGLTLHYEGGEHRVVVDHIWKENVFSYLLLTEVPPERITGASLKGSDYDYKPIRMHGWDVSELMGSTSVRVNSIQVNFMSHVDPKVRQDYSARLCPVEWMYEEEIDKLNPRVRFSPCEV